jgi:hypothetical protein
MQAGREFHITACSKELEGLLGLGEGNREDGIIVTPVVYGVSGYADGSCCVGDIPDPSEGV